VKARPYGPELLRRVVLMGLYAFWGMKQGIRDRGSLLDRDQVGKTDLGR
jgi:hypothetical protein